MGPDPSFSKQGSRRAGRLSDVARVFLAGGVLVMMEMGASSLNWDSRRRLGRASLSILSVSVLVSHLFSLSNTVAAASAQRPRPTDSSDLRVMQSIYVNAWRNTSTTDPCVDDWYGVTCDGESPSQHVLGIDLNGSGGIVSSDFFGKIGGLQHLETLSLANCGLSGNLTSISASPSFLSSMISLNLSRNSFNGEIPSVLGNFSSLQKLSLSHNQLQGQVPKELCQAKSLTVLMLGSNSLGGPIPQCLGNLSSLAVLDISYNSLSGHIPESLGQLEALTDLDLGINSLTGPLPAQLTGLSNLTKLHLCGNLLDGALPVDFDRMSKLQELYLDSNQFTGPIPVSICNVRSLRKLRLFDNQLTGSIPEHIGNLTKLTHLFLQVNQLSGLLPMSLGNLTLLQELQIQGNRFNGTLTGSILAGFSSLRSLYIHNNQLEGQIPSEILFLTTLTNISLGFNNFSGPIPDPQQLSNMSASSGSSNINLLSLCNNSLTGRIPPAVGRLGNLHFLDVSNNQLNGSIPPQLLTQIKSGNQLQANLIFNNFDESSWATIPGGGSCLQLNNASLNRQCQAPSFSEGLDINVGGPQVQSGKGHNFVADNSISFLLGSYENSSDSGGTVGNRDSSSTPWVVSEQGVVQESASTNIVTNSDGSPQGSLDFDWTIFQTARVGADTLSYTIGSMKPGDYVINLLFAELDPSVVRAGQRVFDVYIQGVQRFASLDIFNMTGSTMKPLILPFPLSLDLGVISIRLDGRGSWPATQEQMTVYRGPILCALNIDRVRKSKSSVAVLAGALGAGGFLVVAVVLSVCVGCVVWRRRRKNRMVVCTWNNVGLLSFKYAELEAATRKFSEGNLLGQGAFGKVFKGVLPDGATVAIKQLSIPSPSSLECLQNELQVISTVRHKNLVPLIGCCLDLDCPILVCQYMPNGNLHDALFNESSPIFLSWATRRKVALDIARGLHYLHEESIHKIVHRDVKPANILLDSKLNAHITDFGMARLLAEQEIEVITGVMGTRGYMAPEYALNGQLSDKVDVFSFGVVLLELVIGRRGMQSVATAQEKVPLCHWAWQMFMAGEFEEMVDKRLGKDHDLSEVLVMLKVAIWCTEYYQSLRPAMSQVLNMLTGQAAIPPLPQDRKGYGEAIDFGRPFGSESWEQCVSETYGDKDLTPTFETYGGKGPTPTSETYGDRRPTPSLEYSCSGSCATYADPELDSLQAR